MKLRSRLRALWSNDVRDVAYMVIGVFLLIVAAVVLSTPPPQQGAEATAYGAMQGIPQYEGGWPSPLSCAQGSYLCYPGTRLATFSIARADNSTGMSVNVDRYNQSVAVGGPTLTIPINTSVSIQWACQPYQYSSQNCGGNLTCDNCCNCSWWGGCAPCYAPVYFCGQGYINENTDWTVGTNFTTGGARMGSVTVSEATAGTKTYTLSCYKHPGTLVANASIQVTYTNTPTATISASPQNVNWGGSSSVTWNSNVPAPQCSLTSQATP